MWIESHQGLARHPKLKRLARRLGTTPRDAIGVLHLLWWWALDYAQDGDLTRHDPDDVADACWWDGDPAALLGALAAAGFVDADGRIHDWHVYAGKLIDRRRADAERKRRLRQQDVPPTVVGTSADDDGTTDRTSGGRPADKPDISGGRDADAGDMSGGRLSDVHTDGVRTVPNRTVPTVPNQPTTGERARADETPADVLADAPTPVEEADAAPPGSAPSPPKAKADAGGPLPADWRPDAGLLAWAEGKGWPRGWIDDQTELFLGYWREERPTERKRAWGQAWQRWLNAEAAKRRPASNGHAPRRPAGPPVAAGPGYAVLPAGKPLPDGWSPGSDLLSWAAREGWEPDAVEAVTAEFAARARDTGRLNADWGAAWKTFLRGYRRPAAPAKGAA